MWPKHWSCDQAVCVSEHVSCIPSILLSDWLAVGRICSTSASLLHPAVDEIMRPSAPFCECCWVTTVTFQNTAWMTSCVNSSTGVCIELCDGEHHSRSTLQRSYTCSACRPEYFPVVSDLRSAVSADSTAVTPAEAEPSQQQPGGHQGDPPAPN